MLRAILALIFLVLGAVALARGLYLQSELTRQLDTGAMGVVRSWIMWSTTDGRELVAWYRKVTPWLIWGGGGSLALGLTIALWPGAPVPALGNRPGANAVNGVKPPAPPRKPRKAK